MPGDQSLADVITARQRHHLLIGSAVGFGAAAVLFGVIGVVLGQNFLPLAAGAGAALAFVYLYGTISSARSYTRFGPAGVRSRGLWGGAEEYRWDQIANVAIQRVVFPSRYRTAVWRCVVVTTTAGDKVRLAAPLSRSMDDPEFTRQFRQIRASWQRATGITGTAETEPSTWLAGAVWLGAAAGVQLLALVVIFATMPYFAPAWTAHEGGGTPGVFTSGIRNCPQPGCSWFGTFNAGFSRAKYATLEPGGPVIRAAGQSVAAVDTGRKWVVYPAGGGTAWELPAAGVTAGAAIVVLLLAGELLVPACRRLARRRRAAATAHGPPASRHTHTFADGGRHDPTAREQIGHHRPGHLIRPTAAPERSPNRPGPRANPRDTKPRS